MCSLYIRHDIMASHDLKIRTLKASYGLEGIGIYWSILELMAEKCVKEGGDTSMHLDTFLIAGMIGLNPKRWYHHISDIIRYFGLFEIEVRKDGREYFYSPRLKRDFHEGVILRGIAQATDEQGEGYTDEIGTPRVKTKRELTAEARKAMSAGGRKGNSGGRPRKQGRNKVDAPENKVENKVDAPENKVEPSKNKVSGGDYRGGKAPKIRRQEDISLPQPPQGGFESVRAEIDKIEDEGLRKTVDSLLFPDSAYRAYGLAFQKIYNEVTAGDPSFAKSEMLTYGVIGHAKEVFWSLIPKREDGSMGRPSVGDVIGALDRVREVFKEAKASTFLRSRPAMANLSWIIEPNNFVKVAEGNYRDAPSPSPPNTTPPPAARGYSNAMWEKEERKKVELTPELQALYDKHIEDIKQREHANNRRAEEGEGGAG